MDASGAPATSGETEETINKIQRLLREVTKSVVAYGWMLKSAPAISTAGWA